MHTPLTQQSQSGLTMLSKHSVQTHQGNEHTWRLSGNTCPQWSQLAEPLWTDPLPKEWNSCVSHSKWEKQEKKSRWEMICSTFHLSPHMQGIATHTLILQLCSSLVTGDVHFSVSGVPGGEVVLKHMSYIPYICVHCLLSSSSHFCRERQTWTNWGESLKF